MLTRLAYLTLTSKLRKPAMCSPASSCARRRLRYHG